MIHSVSCEDVACPGERGTEGSEHDLGLAEAGQHLLPVCEVPAFMRMGVRPP